MGKNKPTGLPKDEHFSVVDYFIKALLSGTLHSGATTSTDDPESKMKILNLEDEKTPE